MEKTHYVYVLWSECESNIRYVGISTNVKSRFSSHKSNAVQPHHSSYKSHKATWIRKCLRDNVRIGYTIIGTCATLAEANALEIKMIASYKQLGFKLTNTSTGGDGAPGVPCSDEKRETLRIKNSGQNMSDATRERLRVSHLGQVRTPEAIEQARQKVIGQKRTPETLQRMSDAQTGRKHSDKTKELLRQANLGKTIPVETREKISAANKGRAISDAQKAQVSAVHKGKTVSEKTRQKLREHVVTDEARRNMSNAGKGRKNAPEAIEATRRGNTGQRRTPEQRENIRLGRERAKQKRNQDFS